MATETVTIHITAATRNPRGENTDEEIDMDEALWLLQIMHTGVARTSLYADLALSLAFTCLINTLVGALAVLPWHRVVAPVLSTAPNGMDWLMLYRCAGSDSACVVWLLRRSPGAEKLNDGVLPSRETRANPHRRTEQTVTPNRVAWILLHQRHIGTVMVPGRLACPSWSYFAGRKGLLA